VITKITIKNYKSIEKIDLSLGRINVFIGENGAGKSNILEAIALAGAASAGKLDNEFLASRGIRVTSPTLMRSNFPGCLDEQSDIEVDVFDGSETEKKFLLKNDNADYSQWQYRDSDADLLAELGSKIEQKINSNKRRDERTVNDMFKLLEAIKRFNVLVINNKLNISRFVIYSLENSALRTFEKEGQIQPLGINGEGLLKLLTVLSQSEHSATLNEIKSHLSVLGWFKDFNIVPSNNNETSISIADRFLSEERPFFDQKSANEGFLYLLFYYALFASKLTPSFFAIDNIDVSLNPKLCTRLIQSLVVLAKTHDKQAILTTHNPALLDGLNLDDDEQRLFVVSRDSEGKTKVKRVKKPALKDGFQQPKLSAMFMNGSLGGLPKGF
jgi:predicted ATPase